MTPTPTDSQVDQQVELAVTGMTCASCANRIERKLNKLDGVTATVNYATEKAKVSFVADISPDLLLTTVEEAGYAATLPPRRVLRVPRRSLVPRRASTRCCSGW